jgi:hypothetical protein
MKASCVLFTNSVFANCSVFQRCVFVAFKPPLHEPSINGYDIMTKTGFCYTTITDSAFSLHKTFYTLLVACLVYQHCARGILSVLFNDFICQDFMSLDADE